MMDSLPHKALHFIDHLWPYVTGFAITLLATVKLWWHDKQQVKRRIRTLETLAESAVTKHELQKCRDDVRQVDEANVEKIYNLIREGNKENHQQHIDLGNQILDTHKQIIKLHNGKP